MVNKDEYITVRYRLSQVVRFTFYKLDAFPVAQ